MDLFGFIGTPCFDCLFYLGNFLAYLGKKVYLFDGAGENWSADCDPGPGFGLEYKDGFDVGRLLPGGGYDIVLLQLSFEELQSGRFFDRRSGMNGWYIFGDFFYQNIDKVLDCMKSLPGVKGIIIRDEPPGKINRGYLERVLFMDRPAGCIFYTVPLDEEDYGLRVRMGYEPVRRAPGLSPGYQALLRLLAEAMTGIPERQLRKRYRMWERRRKI